MQKTKQENVKSNLGDDILFFTLVRSHNEEKCASLLIESLRNFGGIYQNSPVWVFLPEPEKVSLNFSHLDNVGSFSLDVDTNLRKFYFSDKIYACAKAEQMVGSNVRSLVWLSSGCFVFNPPVLFDLTPEYDAALRPVHIRNIGSPIDEQPDEFWQKIYEHVGIESTPFTVTSFVDAIELRPYFNTHLFSINPARQFGRTWWEQFQTILSDSEFQQGIMENESHHVFLHQAVFSALITKSLPQERIVFLPPEYSYPLNFHKRLEQEKQAKTLNDLICPVHEDDVPSLETIQGLSIDEPLKSWILERM